MSKMAHRPHVIAPAASHNPIFASKETTSMKLKNMSPGERQRTQDWVDGSHRRNSRR
jgi:hypothetical protein